MHRRSWRGPLASSFSRPLNHAQYGAVLFVVALVILACGIGLLHRQQLAGIGGSFQETQQPDIARLHGSSAGEKGGYRISASLLFSRFRRCRGWVWDGGRVTLFLLVLLSLDDPCAMIR